MAVTDRRTQPHLPRLRARLGRGAQPNRRMRGAKVPSGPSARPTDHTVAVPGTGASRTVQESPSPATAGSLCSVNDCPFQARKSGPGTNGG